MQPEARVAPVSARRARTALGNARRIRFSLVCSLPYSLRLVIIIIRFYQFRAIGIDADPRASAVNMCICVCVCVFASVCMPSWLSNVRTDGRREFGDPAAAFRFCANIDAPWRDAIALTPYAPRTWTALRLLFRHGSAELNFGDIIIERYVTN